MRTLIALLVCFVSAFSYAQQWEDSLRVARKLYHQKRYGESLEKYKTAQRLAPKSVDLSDEMGQTAYKAEDFAQAEKCYNQSVSKKGTQHEQAKTYHNLGNTKFKQKKYDEAITSYKEALRRNPNDEQTRYNLSEAMKKQQSKQQQSGQQPKQQNGKQQSNQPPQEQNQVQNGQKKSQSQQQSSAKSQNSGSKLSDKSTEKALDELVKKEMETKKKLGSNKGKNTSSTTQKGSGKDW